MSTAVWLELVTRAVQYIPPLLRTGGICIIFLCAWGVNVRLFERSRVPVRLALGYKKHDADPLSIFAACKVMFLWLLTCIVLHELLSLQGYERAKNVPVLLFWVVVCVTIGWSTQKAFSEIRTSIKDRVQGFFAFREVRFIDVLACDALTSMSNLLAESASVICAVLGLFHSTTSSECRFVVLSACLATLPYVIRAWQCFVTWFKAGNRPQLINLGKYLSVVPVIWLPVLKSHPAYHADPDQRDLFLDQVWLYSVLVYTAYSFTWDIFMDWGLAWPTPAGQHAPFLLRPVTFYDTIYYYLAIVANLTLRLCWTLKLSARLQMQVPSEAFTFLFELLEVFRRFVWIFFRVEWECVKEGYSTPPSTPSPLTRLPSGSPFFSP
eukprot:m.717828 g.717828  ORF g.717828 m.717828 type:complete len:380 (-) comp58809_c0_seq1:155-1294(-)